ncbi:MAG: TIGR03668 family PPOX class F420-dependent oxidoreductase [Streptosporangiales bacterium]|nr:TIGR03668 family PPOX class F420-dependent oxidoreductase [Streptosporangiales bacterium]
MRIDTAEARRRFAAARVARLASADPDGRPHLVPVTFVLDGDRLLHVVDEKPKRSRDLRRVRNLRADPRAGMLADHYDDDWSHLWWVRADGEATVSDDGEQIARAVDLLAAKYPQYHEQRVFGPLVALTVHRWTGWAAAHQ